MMTACGLIARERYDVIFLQGVADRVCLGLLPSSEGSWATAVRALRCSFRSMIVLDGYFLKYYVEVRFIMS